MKVREVRLTAPGVATSDGAGVQLNRLIGGPTLPDLDPFLLFDAFDSDESADYIAGFPAHPHRGFETVTYMLAGRMRHEDNQGNAGTLRAGSVQWMTAGRGIVHSEMPEQEEGLMSGFQLWVNLPAAEKMCAPRYQNIEPADVPELERQDGVRVRVIAGQVDGIDGAVNGIGVDPLYLDVTLPPRTRFDQPVPPDHNAFCYVIEGAAKIGGPDATWVSAGHLAVLGAGDAIGLGAAGDAARLLVIAGRPLNEPVERYGPFVMNNREEIVQAIHDYQNGTFA